MKEALINIFDTYFEIYATEFHKIKWSYKKIARACKYIAYVNVCDRDVLDYLLYHLLLHGYDITICDFNGYRICRRVRRVENDKKDI